MVINLQGVTEGPLANFSDFLLLCSPINDLLRRKSDEVRMSVNQLRVLQGSHGFHSGFLHSFLPSQHDGSAPRSRSKVIQLMSHRQTHTLKQMCLFFCLCEYHWVWAKVGTIHKADSYLVKALFEGRQFVFRVRKHLCLCVSSIKADDTGLWVKFI